MNSLQQEAINALVEEIHLGNISKGFYTDLTTGERLVRNIPELICLVHSELSEAMEGYRKNIKDDKIHHRDMIEVELADAVIRIFYLAGYLNLDLAGAMFDKLEYNKIRKDHQMENRRKIGGKKF